MIKVNPIQKNNNILTHINKSTWHYSNHTTDYEINDEISVLFLSIKFHVSKPEYIHRRFKKLEKYKHNILLLRIDSVNYESVMLELFEICNSYKSVIVMCFSDQECGAYLTAFDIKNKSFMSLRRKCDNVREFLKIVPKINKVDVEKVIKCVGSLKQLIESRDEWLKNAVGLSEAKVDIMKKYFKMEF